MTKGLNLYFISVLDVQYMIIIIFLRETTFILYGLVFLSLLDLLLEKTS